MAADVKDWLTLQTVIEQTGYSERTLQRLIAKSVLRRQEVASVRSDT